MKGEFGFGQVDRNIGQIKAIYSVSKYLPSLLVINLPVIDCISLGKNYKTWKLTSFARLLKTSL